MVTEVWWCLCAGDKHRGQLERSDAELPAKNTQMVDRGDVADASGHVPASVASKARASTASAVWAHDVPGGDCRAGGSVRTWRVTAASRCASLCRRVTRRFIIIPRPNIGAAFGERERSGNARSPQPENGECLTWK